MAVSLTPEAIDAILEKMEAALSKVSKSQESSVKLPGAELELLRYIEEARNFMTELVKEADRTHLHQIFGGDCARISHIRAVLENTSFSSMNVNDQRLRTCLDACGSVEAVLRDSGFESKLKQAQQEEREKMVNFLNFSSDIEIKQNIETDNASSDTEIKQNIETDESVLRVQTEECEEPGSNMSGALEEHQMDECEARTLAACALENDAIELDRSGDVAEAIKKYSECALELQRAVDTALPAYAADHGRLVKHREEVMERMEYLESLQGSAPGLPVEKHIHPVQLDMCAELCDDDSSKRRTTKHATMVAVGGVAAGALVFSGGFLVLGAAAALGTAATVTSASLMGATMAGGTAGAVGTGYCVKYHTEKVDTAVDTVSQRVSSAASNTAGKVRQFSKETGLDKHATKVGETGSFLAGKAKQGYKDIGARISSSDLGAKLANTKSKVVSKGGNFIEKGAETAASLGDKLFDGFTKTKSRTNVGGSFSGLVGRAQNLTNSFVGSSSSSRAKCSSEDGPSNTTEATHDLRIEVVCANGLAEPEYRVGDFTSSFLGGGGTKLSAVYVEIAVGSKRLATGTAQIVSDASGHHAEYSHERLLFPYRNETHIQVFVRDKRTVQSAVRGDPQVGEGRFNLEIADLMHMQQQLAEVPLMSGAQPAGTVTLRYQLLPLMGSSSEQPRLDTLQPTPSSEDFVTPPGSPRESA